MSSSLQGCAQRVMLFKKKKIRDGEVEIKREKRRNGHSLRGQTHGV